MPDEEKDTKTSVPEASEADARTVQHAIVPEVSSEPAKEVGGETEEKVSEKVEEGEKPEVKEKVEVKPVKEALTPEAIEEAKIAEILSRFKGDPEEVKRQIAKAYREKEKQFSERDGEIGDLRKEALRWKQFQEDLDKDPEGTAKWLLEKMTKQKEKSSESLMDRALDDPQVLEDYINQKISDSKAQENWQEQEETRMETLHAGWKDREQQRGALREAIQLGKFPYPDEILDLAVRGAASPEKLLADAKVAITKEQNETLAGKMEAQVQTQAGGETEKAPSSDSQIVGDSVLTEEERARR